MIHICSNQSKADRLWGVFIKHLIEMQKAGIEVEYVKKGEVILNGKRYEPVYHDKTMSYNPIAWRYERGQNYIVLTGHNIQPLVDYLVKFNKDRKRGEAIEDMVAECFGEYSPENYEKVVKIVGSLAQVGIIPSYEADRIVSRMDEIDAEEA